MGKFKVGDKVKCVEHVDFFTHNCGKGCGIVSCVSATGGFIEVDGCDIHWNAGMFELDSDEWSVYNNDKPLSELTDEQRGLLVHYLFSNGDVQTFNGEVWLDMLSGFNLINREFTYRAKQKSELELFIEAVNEAQSNAGLMPLPYAEMLFNAGFKAPKVGE